jgi:hypothetical protein
MTIMLEGTSNKNTASHHFIKLETHCINIMKGNIKNCLISLGVGIMGYIFFKFSTIDTNYFSKWKNIFTRNNVCKSLKDTF